MTRTRPCQRTGFTLIELIFASTIMALLALALFTSLRIGDQARRRVMSAVGPSRPAEVAIETVRRDLESALPPRAGTERSLSGTFLGLIGVETPGTSGVEFYSIAPAPPPTYQPSGMPGGRASFTGARRGQVVSGGIRRVQFVVRQPLDDAPGAAAGGVLVRRFNDNLLNPVQTAPQEQVICHGVTAFVIRYYDGMQWHEEWDSTQFGDVLPIAMEVLLELTHPGADPSQPPRTYQTSRTFFLPARDEEALTGGTL